MKHNRTSIPRLRLIPEIWKYQAFTKCLLVLLLALIRTAALFLLRMTGRVAVSSGDYRFLFRTWQGVLILILFVAVLFFYVSLDLNVKILYAGNVLNGVKEPVRATVKRALRALPKFLNPDGVGVTLYVALIAPLVGAGLNISLTKDLKVPSFISSVIAATPLYSTLYAVLITVFAVIGVAHIFCLHGVLLDGLSIRTARWYSRELMSKHWKHFLLWNTRYALFMFALVTLEIVLFFFAPLTLAGTLFAGVSDVTAIRFLTIVTLLSGSVLTGVVSSLVTPFYIVRITVLYRQYSKGVQITVPPRPGHVSRNPVPFLGLVCIAVFATVSLSSLMAQNFDTYFPRDTKTKIIAHRGGGNEAPENTVAGLKTAIALGSFGSEIDIQRTADGYYIVNHDANFQRVAKDSRTPAEMTLSQVRRLRVQDSDSRVATLEEMLDAAKGHLLLFIELKGDTADTQMCDDVVKIIKKRDMLNEAVVISMKYDLIDYIETWYPEVLSGYLTYFGYGDFAKLNCDFLGVEEQSATPSLIDATHAQGRQVLVWTPNTLDAQEYFLTSNADAIITDNVVQANKIVNRLNERNDFERILSAFRW
ncbi:MAG: glycerophosphoryl diester phosphodiesterase membrane domain-containing protein [Oscillospiraceae bacterium]|nr:glycerophosphoryl diester phosphodiesterase membrane domain-containing protein [Oscillospiraceae bacterium]